MWTFAPTRRRPSPHKVSTGAPCAGPQLGGPARGAPRDRTVREEGPIHPSVKRVRRVMAHSTRLHQIRPRTALCVNRRRLSLIGP